MKSSWNLFSELLTRVGLIADLFVSGARDGCVAFWDIRAPAATKQSSYGSVLVSRMSCVSVSVGCFRERIMGKGRVILEADFNIGITKKDEKGT